MSDYAELFDDLKQALAEQPRGRTYNEMVSRLSTAPLGCLMPWLRHLVAERDVASLQTLATSDTPLHEILAVNLTAHRRPVAENLESPFRIEEPAGLHSVRALACLALVLVGSPSEGKTYLDAGLRWIQYARIATPGASLSWPSTDPLGRALAEAGERFAPGTAGAAAVLLERLADRLPEPEVSAGVEALFDLGSTGRQAKLLVHVVKDRPSGLYPHPDTASLLTTDTEFQNGLDRAWRLAGSARLRCAVLWSIDDGAEPIGYVTGRSVTAALTTLVNEAVRWRHPVRRWPALRKMRPDVAIVGGVDADGKMAAVGGYRWKLAAVAADVRIIVPKDDGSTAERHSGGHEIEAVTTWKKAAWKARGLSAKALSARLILLAGALSTALLAASMALLIVAHGESTQRREKVVQRLINEAGRLQNEDPRLAMLLAAAAVKERPTSQTRKLLFDALTSGTGLATTIPPHGRGGIAASAVWESFALTAGNDGSLRAWDLKTARLADEKPGEGLVVAIVVNPALRDSFATVTKGGQVVFWRSGDDGKLTRGATTVLGTDAVGAAAFSPDGVTLVVSTGNGEVFLVDARSHTVTDRRSLGSKMSTNHDATALAFGVQGKDGSIPLYVGFAEPVYTAPLLEVTVVKGKATTARPLQIGAHEGVRSLAFIRNTSYGFSPDTERTGLLAIGTGLGLQVWDPDKRKDAAQFPVAGVAEPVTQVLGTTSEIKAVTEEGVTTVTADEEYTVTGHRPGIAIAADDGGWISMRHDGTIFVWEDRRPLSGNGPRDDGDQGFYGDSAAFRPNGQVVISALPSNDSTESSKPLKAVAPDVARTPAERELGTLPMARTRILAVGAGVVVSTDTSDPARVIVTDLGTGHSRLYSTCVARAAAFSPDGDRLALGCEEGEVSVHRVRDLRKLGASRTLPEPVSAVAFSADGRSLLVGSMPETRADSPGALHFLDAENPRRDLTAPKGFPGGVTALAIDGDRAYSGWADGHVRTWTTGGKPVGDHYLGRTVSTLSASAGRVAVGTGGIVHLLDESLASIMSRPLSSPDLKSVQLSPDGTVMLTQAEPHDFTNGVHTTNLWYIGDSALISQTCAVAGRDLTDREWRDYGDKEIARPSLCGKSKETTKPSPVPSTIESLSLAPTSGPAEPQDRGNCDDFPKAEECGIIPGGYAWTITRTDSISAKVTFYRSAPGGWAPVITTTGDVSWQFASVFPATTAKDETAFLVVLNTSASVGAFDLTVVRDGQIVGHATGTKIRLSVDAAGVHIWEPVYSGGVAGGLPQGWLSRTFQPGPDGRWVEGPPTQVPPDEAPDVQLSPGVTDGSPSAGQ
ncbi:WD40 repeat domain-containing protein [Actinomadura bangladeshensis]|uniref:WD40 repeat domain-containing protein n=1 Tax=Actinomadura bangladeshensis TaxID=453573 RepID=A0A6L9QF47_9ACTN|nr:WD40 repeat domain-containing protein [Actinomadura bangladeshensis]NEA23658.1 WD40 repeat domain-containing protein [Actinomadura bangladeshensis]